MAEVISVLLVEDHASLCEALTARMEREDDIRVVGTASAPAEAMSMIGILRPDVVVLDVELGLSNGLELIRRIQSDATSSKVVVLTCRSDTATVVVAFREGAQGFVHKSAPIEELLCAIRNAARGELWAAPSVLTKLLPHMLAAPGHVAGGPQFDRLTDREREVLSLMVEGMANAAIAERLHLSIHTVRTHAHNVQTKLKVRSKLAAVALVHQKGVRLT